MRTDKAPTNHVPLAVNAKQAADMLGIHENTALALLRNRILPGKKLGRRWLVPVSEIEAFLKPDSSRT